MTPEVYLATALTGAFIGSLSAFLFNFFLEIIKTNTSRVERLKAELISTLNTLREDAVYYWSGDYSSDVKVKILTEQKIKQLIRYQNYCIDKLIEKSSKNMIVSEKVSLVRFKNESFDLITGGSFEGEVESDLKKCKKIAEKYSRVLVIVGKHAF